MRKIGVGVGTTAAVGGGAIRLDHGPVQESEAIAPAVVAAGVGGSIAVGWALREYEILGSDSPPQGTTANAFRSEMHSVFRSRESTNASTIVDNNNILEGISNTAFADGKIAAIDALNEQESESDVLAAAQEAVTDYHHTVKNNFLETWNEAARELRNYVEGVKEHPDLGLGEFIATYHAFSDQRPTTFDFPETTETMPNGNEMDVVQIRVYRDINGNDRGCTWSPVSYSEIIADDEVDVAAARVDIEGYDYFEYMDNSDWSPMLDDMDDMFSNIQDEISMWVSSVYGDVQAGDLDTAELLTPREQAELTAEDEDFPQAIADLQALNVSVDLEREAEIYLDDVGATLYGQLAYTGDKSLSTGSVDPDETDEDGNPVYPGTIYFNYDLSQGEGVWEAYDSGVDGGTVTLTSEPFEQTRYVVHTTSGESAEFTTADLTEDGGDYTVDVSDQLEDQITEVERIDYYADVSSTQYETIQLTDSFEIIDFTDSDGNSYDETNFERSEPHTDDNYITEEEWQEQQERHEELIQQYEDAQGSAGILPDFDNIGDIPAEYIAAAAAVVGGAALFGNSG